MRPDDIVSTPPFGLTQEDFAILRRADRQSPVLIKMMSGDDRDADLLRAIRRETQPSLCEDCPPVGYPTDKTRCAPCPRRTKETL